ncbi:MAG TPA: AMP-binding protein [Acidimicrobiales bacterium]|nr:AMP-binding protein [Acidimicrobiales bacterium]
MAGAAGWARHLPAGVDPASVDLLAEGSLPAAWARRWSDAPGRPVVRDPGGRWLTGADLLGVTAEVAGRLAAAGLRAGDRVVLSGPASADMVVAYGAALRSGLVVVPVNPSYSRRELAVLLEDAAPAAAIMHSAELRGWAAELSRATRIFTMDVPGAGGPPPPLDGVATADPALLVYTSGTTGRPKGAVLSHGNLLASAEAVRLAWRWTPEDRLILCLPLFHMHGLGVGLNGTLLVGASAVLHNGFEPEGVLAAAGEGATMFFGVPTMYARLVDAQGAARLGGLRLCVSGSAPLDAGLHRRVEAVCGQAVLERYGMTETVMLVSNPYEGERRPGTVGFPLPGVEVRLAEGSGEIEVRGPNVFDGYLGRSDADPFTADGWFRTGDIGATDADGYLSIVGRSKELIITGGYNVYPREVEDVLRAHPGVVDAAVVGTPSEEWGEVVTAYVEVVEASPFDPSALVDWAAARLAPYKRPRIFHRVEALPRNRLGKVLRDQLQPPSGQQP